MPFSYPSSLSNQALKQSLVVSPSRSYKIRMEFSHSLSMVGIEGQKKLQPRAPIAETTLAATMYCSLGVSRDSA
jgi:hypothetical protein